MTPHNEGDLVDAKCVWGAPPFATLKITRVTEVHYWDLTDEDARADGFNDLHDMRKWLDETYPLVENFVRIDFEVVEPTGGT